MVALGMFLAVLFFAGGCAVTYALMVEPQRAARQKLVRLQTVESDLRDEHERLTAWSTSLAHHESTLAAQLLEFEKRSKVFESRVITYDNLAGENQILKTDLRNIALQFAHQDALNAQVRHELVQVKDQRDRLGRAYFREVWTAARKNITPGNYEGLKQRVQSVATEVQDAGVTIAAIDRDEAFAALKSQHERAIRAAIDREEQARVREEMRDNIRAERERQEAEREHERAEQARRAIEEALRKAMEEAKAQRDDALGTVTAKHAEEVERLKEQLAEAEAKSQRALSMAQQTKQGHVYVISNIGSFGPDVYKIGMTRRLNPQDRIDELGDASVPFGFDVHMSIRCLDAPKLESALHRAFHHKRVNKVNPRKEFFRVTLAEVVKAVRENHGEVDYVADAEAWEYRRSQGVTDEELDRDEDRFTEAEEGDETETNEDEDEDEDEDAP